MSQANGNGAASQPRCCGQCRHWVEQPRPRTAGAVDMSQPLTGLCVESPPTVTTLPDGRDGTLTLAGYPQLPEGFMACSRFVARVGLKVVTD